MRMEERECLVVMLAATAGSTDAWSYFGLGHVFVANMTGNTVLLGAALSHGHVARVLRPAWAIGCYVCGVFAGTALLETVFARWAGGVGATQDEEEVWPRTISWVLGIESVLQAHGRGMAPATRWFGTRWLRWRLWRWVYRVQLCNRSSCRGL